MPLDIGTITVNSNKREILALLRSHKYTRSLATQLKRPLDYVEYKVAKDLTVIMYDSARSASPIYAGTANNKKRTALGGTLRNTGIENNLPRISQSTPIGRVFVKDTVHNPPYEKYGDIAKTNSSLADILNAGRSPMGGLYKRSRNSLAIAGYSTQAARTPTKDWILTATNEYQTKRVQYFAQNGNNLFGYASAVVS